MAICEMTTTNGTNFTPAIAAADEALLIKLRYQTRHELMEGEHGRSESVLWKTDARVAVRRTPV
jgi:hypothetical protein